jgi:phosphopantetheine adenylyltransferase
MPKTRLQVVSSSAIKELLTFGCDISKYVPKCILERIKAKFKNN